MSSSKVKNATHCSASAPNGLHYPECQKVTDQNGGGVLAAKTSYQTLKDYMLDTAKILGERQSFFTFDLADVLWKIQQWKEKLPNIEIFYAVKANTDPVLLRLLVKLGLSFDCATEGEIAMMLKTGASPKNILWAHTIKTSEGLRYAEAVGVDFMTFDSVDELEKIHDVFPRARLLLRLRPSVVSCVYDLSEKFGCSAAESKSILLRAKELEMNIIGMSFHVGALCKEPEVYAQTIRDCAEIFKVAQQMGFNFTVLNVGGGFLGSSGSQDIFEKVAERIRSTVEESFGGHESLRLMAEPGCYVVASAVVLVTTIIGKRTILEEGETNKHYYINNGIYSCFYSDFEHYDIRPVPLLAKTETAKRPKTPCTIFGQTCCSEDVILKNHVLTEVQTGECLAWVNFGAYSQAVCSTFCGVPIPSTVYAFIKKPKINVEEMLTEPSVKELLDQNIVCIGSDCLDS